MRCPWCTTGELVFDIAGEDPSVGIMGPSVEWVSCTSNCTRVEDETEWLLAVITELWLKYIAVGD